MSVHTENEAGPSREGWHTTTLRIPFYTPQHAEIARQALEVDREQNGTFVHRELSTEGDVLIAHYETTTVRLLRLSTNSFLSSLDLLVRTMSSFAPDPNDKEITDEELERIKEQANMSAGGSKEGIELKGDGRGAGSGEEVKSES
ncbi:uncharacterized protein I303_102074 [Kwoniella dejecticola CBS 10117]|uniref:Transcription factor Pcc1 n=1 Tax=Kwoniella dejecticola CBS 10117 TaxID=1296121 RepID=A0A1A6ABY8_9TREE|nr:uncharacterized protein I303_01785 [Kwoniella dejecticola CBS 10117]OBR87577.1 hypothetical protein I303_01785 [Kwoniella dejecticola CBS 10117]